MLNGACFHTKPAQKETDGDKADGVKKATVYCCEQDRDDKKCCHWRENQRRDPPQELAEKQLLHEGADYNDSEQQDRCEDRRARQELIDCF